MFVVYRYIIRVDEYIIKVDYGTNIQNIRENIIMDILNGP